MFRSNPFAVSLMRMLDKENFGDHNMSSVQLEDKQARNSLHVLSHTMFLNCYWQKWAILAKESMLEEIIRSSFLCCYSLCTDKQKISKSRYPQCKCCWQLLLTRCSENKACPQNKTDLVISKTNSLWIASQYRCSICYGTPWAGNWKGEMGGGGWGGRRRKWVVSPAKYIIRQCHSPCNFSLETVRNIVWIFLEAYFSFALQKSFQSALLKTVSFNQILCQHLKC